MWLSGKESICQCRRHGFHPTSRLGASPGARNGNPLQYSHLGNPMGRGLWQATVHSVTKSRTRLSDLTTAIIWGRGWWYDLMTGGSELKLEKGGCTERSSWGARRTLPHPHTWWHQGHGRKHACLRGGRENHVLRGQSGCSHWNVKGAFRIPVISLMKVPGTSKERETGVSSVWDFVGITLPTVSTVHHAGGPSQLENSRKRMTKK